MTRIRINIDDVRWILMMRARLEYTGLRGSCLTKHNATATKDGRTNEFSEVISDDGTLGLAKVPGADANWRRNNGIENPGINRAIVTVYTKQDHFKARRLIHDRNEDGTKKAEVGWNWTKQWKVNVNP